jgi:hypothetical protein
LFHKTQVAEERNSSRMPQDENAESIQLSSGGARSLGQQGDQIKIPAVCIVRDTAMHRRKGRDAEWSKGWHVFHWVKFSKARRGFFFMMEL